MRSVTDYFGCMVFDDKAMRLRLPTEIYEAMKRRFVTANALI